MGHPEVSGFVSYERSCHSFVLQFAAELERRGVPARGDWQLVPGEDWWDRIGDLIRGSDTFLFLLTPESARSPNCLRELDLALTWGKRILPLVREQPSDDDLTELREVLAKKHWVFVRSDDDHASAMDSVITAVRTDFELTLIHTRLALSTDAWEKRVGDLLRGTYLRVAQNTIQRMDERKPLLPAAAPKMRLFVAESRMAEGRRRRRAALAALTVIVITGLLSWIAWQRNRLANQQSEIARAERRRAEAEAKSARLEQLQRQGESAVTAVRSGDIPAAVSLLETVVANDVVGDLPSYHTIHRFLRPVLTPALEMISKLPRPSVFRWRGKDFALGQDGRLVSLPGATVELFAIAGHERYLVTSDVAHSVCIFELAGFVTIQCFPMPGTRLRGIYERTLTGALAFVSEELALGSDEDEPTAEEVIGLSMTLITKPHAKPRTIGTEEFKATACGKEKDQPCGFRALAVRGRQGARTLTFPSVRPEHEYWHAIAIDSPDIPTEWKVSASDRESANSARAGRLDFSHALYSGSDSTPRIQASDGLFSSWFFRLQDVEYISTEVVVGNQWVSEWVCSIGPGLRVGACRSVVRTAASTPIFAPDDRHLVIFSPEVQDNAFQLLQVPSLQRCANVDGPLERAVTADFTPDGRHLAVASQDGEIWIYSIGLECSIKLQRKIFSPQLENWAIGAGTAALPTGKQSIGLAFFNERDLIATHDNKEMIAFDALTGVLKWSVSGVGSSTAGTISLAASPDGALLAAWSSDKIQVIHSATGIPLSSAIGFSRSKPGTGGAISRVLWRGESVIAEWNDVSSGSSRRMIRRRLSPAEAEAQFLRGVETSSLINFPRVEHPVAGGQ